MCPICTSLTKLLPYATPHPPNEKSIQHQLRHHTQPDYHSRQSQSALHPSTWLPTSPKLYVGEQSYALLHCPTSTEPTHQHIQPTTLANLDKSTKLDWRYEPKQAVPPSQWQALGGYQYAYMHAYQKCALY